MIHQGFWNGEPCNYWCVVVKVGSVEGKLPLHWSEAFVGELRQAVRIHPPHGRADFYIDNDDGLGMFKVLSGGKGVFPHRDLPHVEEIKVIEAEARWRKVQNWKRYKNTQRKADNFWRKKDPEGFVKMEQMAELIHNKLDEHAAKRMTNEKKG